MAGIGKNAAMTTRSPRLVPLVLLVLLLAACASEGARQRTLDTTLYEYAGAVRWGGLDRIWSYVDPELREKHPLSALEYERLGLFQVTGYQVVNSSETPEGNIVRLAQIGVVNRHTQAERVIGHREEWRWDAEAKRWWLISGVPEIGGGR